MQHGLGFHRTAVNQLQGNGEPRGQRPKAIASLGIDQPQIASTVFELRQPLTVLFYQHTGEQIRLDLDRDPVRRTTVWQRQLRYLYYRW